MTFIAGCDTDGRVLSWVCDYYYYYFYIDDSNYRTAKRRRRSGLSLGTMKHTHSILGGVSLSYTSVTQTRSEHVSDTPKEVSHLFKFRTRIEHVMYTHQTRYGYAREIFFFNFWTFFRD